MQVETGKQPTVVASAINGHAVVRFDGVDDRMSLSENVFSADALPRTLFAVIQSNDYQGHVIGTGASVMGAFTTQGYALGLAANKPFIKASSENGGLWLLSPDNLKQHGLQIISATIANAGAQLRSSCNLVNDATMPAAANFTTAYLGGTHDGAESLAGDIAEILVYNRLLDATEQTEVWNYLAGKYAVMTAAPEDGDMDGRFDACDTGAVYLKSPDITVTLESPASFQGGTASNIINAASPTVFDRHSNSSHVWAKGDTTLLFDLQGVYHLEAIHFWNFNTEGYDTDSIQFSFYDSANTLLSKTTVAPQTGFENILAEDFAVDVSGVRYVRALMTSTNGEVEFQNIGFSGTLEGINP